MDNFDHDNVTLADTGIPGGATVDKLASAAKNLAKGIRDRSKAKNAQKISDAGNYWTLRPYLKSLIPIPQYVLDQVGGQGITEEAVLQLPEQAVGANQQSIIEQLKKLSGLSTVKSEKPSTTVPASEEKKLEVSNYKKYIPYIIGAVIIGLIIWFASKN